MLAAAAEENMRYCMIAEVHPRHMTVGAALVLHHGFVGGKGFAGLDRHRRRRSNMGCWV